MGYLVPIKNISEKSYKKTLDKKTDNVLCLVGVYSFFFILLFTGYRFQFINYYF